MPGRYEQLNHRDSGYFILFPVPFSPRPFIRRQIPVANPMTGFQCLCDLLRQSPAPPIISGLLAMVRSGIRPLMQFQPIVKTCAEFCRQSKQFRRGRTVGQEKTVAFICPQHEFDWLGAHARFQFIFHGPIVPNRVGQMLSNLRNYFAPFCAGCPPSQTRLALTASPVIILAGTVAGLSSKNALKCRCMEG